MAMVLGPVSQEVARGALIDPPSSNPKSSPRAAVVRRRRTRRVHRHGQRDCSGDAQYGVTSVLTTRMHTEMKDVIDRLSTLPGTQICPCAPEEVIARLQSARLPAEHLQFLAHSNGASAAHGYVRLFGSDCAQCVDLQWWNDVETWKFAWPPPVQGYLAFGETGWGDQFAYSLEGLSRGDSTVYVLDAFEMQPGRLAAGFSDFVTGEFLRQAEEPYDSMTRGALARIGPLGWNEHVTYMPSLLLGGEEDLDHVVKLKARASMIISGDIATQAAAAPDSPPTSVVTYEDHQGRLRTRIVWE